MLSNIRVIALRDGCIIALLILTSCQPTYSTLETKEEKVSVSEEIVDKDVVVETVETAQPTVEQLPILQPTIEKLPFGQPEISQPTIERPSVEPEEIIQPPQKSSPKILLIDGMADWDGLTYARLIEIAASKGVEVDVSQIVNDSYDGIIVFSGGGGYNETSYGGTSQGQLMDLIDFTTGGKRLVIFALPRLAKFNHFLWGNGWTFGVTVASDEYLIPPKAVISVPGGVLSEMWSGLEIGSKTAYDDVSLQTYFESPAPFTSTSMANIWGIQRKTSILGYFTSGEYLFISNFATGDGEIQYRNSGNFLHDGNIDGWDNKRAVEILIDWLVGNE